MVRVSRSIRDLAYRVLQEKEKYLRENGKEPTIDELAKILEVEQEEIVMSLDAIQDPISLQEPVYKDGTENLYVMDQVRDTKNIDERWVENLTIAQALKKLNSREKEIIGRSIAFSIGNEFRLEELKKTPGGFWWNKKQKQVLDLMQAQKLM